MRSPRVNRIAIAATLQIFGVLSIPATSALADTCPSNEDAATCAKQLAAVDEIADESFGPNKVADPLITDAKAAVRSLSRPIDVFHWVDIRNIGLSKDEVVKPNDPRVRTYLEKEAANFWDLTDFGTTGKVGEIGNGLYAGMDPGISSSFGGDEKAVVAITLPKKTSFLDIRYAIAPLSQASLSELAKAGCAAKDLPSVFTDNNPDCFKFVPPLVSRLGVTAVFQNWSWSQLMDCGAKPGVAIMIVEPGPVEKRDGYRFYGANSDPSGDDAEEMRNIEQGALEWGLPSDTTFVGKTMFPGSSDLKFRWGPLTQFNPRDKYLDWMKNSLYTCGDGNYQEDALDPKSPGISSVAPPDREAADLMDRYLVDLAHFNNVDPIQIHTVSSMQISKDEQLPSSVTKPPNNWGQFWYQNLQSWGLAAGLANPAYSQGLQNYLNSINAEINLFRDKKTWATWQGDNTNLVQLALSAAQGLLKISPFPSGNDVVARDIMVYIWKSFDQPAVLTPDLMGDLAQLNIADYSSLTGKDLWLNPYREGISRIEQCIKKYDKNPTKAARNKQCGLDP